MIVIALLSILVSIWISIKYKSDKFWEYIDPTYYILGIMGAILFYISSEDNRNKLQQEISINIANNNIEFYKKILQKDRSALTNYNLYYFTSIYYEYSFYKKNCNTEKIYNICKIGKDIDKNLLFFPKIKLYFNMLSKEHKDTKDRDELLSFNLSSMCDFHSKLTVLSGLYSDKKISNNTLNDTISILNSPMIKYLNIFNVVYSDYSKKTRDKYFILKNHQKTGYFLSENVINVIHETHNICYLFLKKNTAIKNKIIKNKIYKENNKIQNASKIKYSNSIKLKFIKEEFWIYIIIFALALKLSKGFREFNKNNSDGLIKKYSDFFFHILNMILWMLIFALVIYTFRYGLRGF